MPSGSAYFLIFSFEQVELKHLELEGYGFLSPLTSTITRQGAFVVSSVLLFKPKEPQRAQLVSLSQVV